MLGLEQYVTKHFKPIYCNMWYDDALGIENLHNTVNRIDDVLGSGVICRVLNSCARRYYTIQINQPIRYNNFSSLLLDFYVQLNVFEVSSLPSSGAQRLQ
jgi:hypothetical protein